jgi:hypothetical protein
MTMNPSTIDSGQPKFPAMSAWGVVFLMLGIPNVYAFLRPRTIVARSNSASRYAWLVLVAMAIAGILELSLV